MKAKWSAGTGTLLTVVQQLHNDNNFSADSEMPHRCCHITNKVENIDRTPAMALLAGGRSGAWRGQVPSPWDAAGDRAQNSLAKNTLRLTITKVNITKTVE